jgi:transcriptional regulator GlxA family with amidase domain
MNITLVAIEHCMPSSIFAPIDILTMANIYWRELTGNHETVLFQTEIVAADGQPVQGFNQITVRPDRPMQAAQHPDLIMIPSLIPPYETVIDRHQDIVAWLREQHAQGVTLASVCSGAFFLAEAGILNGRTATTHWAAVPLFRQRYPHVIIKPQRMIVDEGDVLTAGGACAYIDLSLYLLERYTTPELSTLCAKRLMIDADRLLQSPYMIFNGQKSHQDAKILEAQTWMETHFQKPLNIERIASEIGMGTRNFMRRFKHATGDTPLMYLQRIRIEKAKHVLEITQTGIDEITYQVGYEDSSSFRRLFKRITGLSPGGYRKKFSKVAFPFKA